MSNKTPIKAPSMSDADNTVGTIHRNQNRKENNMNQFNKALFGVMYLILKVSFIIAGVAMIKMPLVHFIVSIPLYQAVGIIILAFLAYLELYAYFVRPTDKKSKKTEPHTALDSLNLAEK